MGWGRARALGWLGAGLLLGAGCDSTGILSSGLGNKPDKKKRDGGAMVDAGSDGGAAAGDASAGADGAFLDDVGAAATSDGGDDCNQPPTVSAGADQIADEGSTVTLTATTSDGHGDGLRYHWTFVTMSTSFSPVHCALGTPDAATTSLTCDNNVIVKATVTAWDGHNAPVSDEVRVQFRNVVATARLLFPADGLVVKKDTPLGTLIEIHDPAPVDALACLLWRDDDMDSDHAFFPPTRVADGSMTCDFPPTNYLTQLTGMRSVLWQVAMNDQGDISEVTHLVVWDNNPAEVVSGQGEMPACTSRARLAFAAHYESPEITVPDGYLRLDDDAANMHFISYDLDWFVVSRIRASYPADRVAIAGHGHNGDKNCTFLLFARGPIWWEWEQGVRWGEGRVQIRCGAEIYDTIANDPFGADDVDNSALARFGSGYVHVVYPHNPSDFVNPCADPAKEGLDCTDSNTKNVQSGVCHGGQCVITCQAPTATSAWGDCDGLARNGCELDLTSDSANCGACGHFCSGDCVQKLCRSP